MTNNPNIKIIQHNTETEPKTAGVEILKNRQLRKWRIYVDYAHDIPDWANRQEGPRGGVYYEVNDQELINELLSPPYHEVENPEEFEEIEPDGDDGYRQTELPEFGDDQDRQTTIDEFSMERGSHLVEREDDGREYWRVYIDDEEEAPDWATVSGPSPEGNLYYTVFDEDLFAELIEEPQHQVDNYDLDEYLSNYEGESVELEKDSLIIKRRFKIYVENETQVPDWARTYEGNRGGIFYVVYNKRLFDELMSQPKHEIPDDFNLQSYMFAGRMEEGDRDEEESDEEKSISVNVIDLSKEVSYDDRQYIDHPNDAPEWADVHEGEQEDTWYYDMSNNPGGEREGTQFEGRSSEEVITAIPSLRKVGFSDGYELLSTMSQEELKEGFLKAIEFGEAGFQEDIWNADLDRNVEADPEKMASISSFMDLETFKQSFDEGLQMIEESDGGSEISKKNLISAGVIYPPTKDHREFVEENYPDEVQNAVGDDLIYEAMQGEISQEEFYEEFYGVWAMNKQSSVAPIFQFAVENIGLIDPGQSVPWARFPARSLHTTKELNQYFEQMNEDCNEIFEDGTTLYRGSGNKEHIANNVESWTSSKEQAEKFGQYIFEKNVNSDQVLMTYEQLPEELQRRYGQKDQEIAGNEVEGVKEHLVLGGKL